MLIIQVSQDIGYENSKFIILALKFFKWLTDTYFGPPEKEIMDQKVNLVLDLLGNGWQRDNKERIAERHKQRHT